MDCEGQGRRMQIDYDPQADAIYVQLRSGEVDDTLTVGKSIFVDVDGDSARGLTGQCQPAQPGDQIEIWIKAGDDRDFALTTG